MFKKIYIILALISTPAFSNKIEIINLPDQPNVIEDPKKNSLVLRQLDEIIKEEIAGKPEWSTKWTTMKGFTLDEAKRYFRDYIEKALKSQISEASLDIGTEKNELLRNQLFTEESEKELPLLQEALEKEIKSETPDVARIDKLEGRIGYYTREIRRLSQQKKSIEEKILTIEKISSTKENEIRKIVDEILSKKHFDVPTANADKKNPLAGTEEDKFKLFQSDRFISTNLFNAFAYGSALTKDKERTDPLIFMLPAQLVEKFYFRASPRHTKQGFAEDYKRWHKPDHKNYVEGRNFEEYYDDIFSDTYFGLPETANEREEYYLKNDISYLSQDNIDSVYEAALKILALTKQNDNIVIFGNSPYFIGRTLKLMIESEPGIKRNIIEFPFSGSPNRTRAGGNFPDIRNLVTPERLSHLKARLSKAGLMADQADALSRVSTYFVDVIASGSGPAYVLETILRDFKEKNITEIPDFRLISLNEITLDDDDPRAKSIAKQDGGDGDEIALYLPSLDKPYFKIPTHIVYMKGHSVFDLIPSKSLRALPEYNASYWTKEYDYLLTQEPPYHMQILFDHFDTNIKDRLAKDN